MLLLGAWLFAWSALMPTQWGQADAQAPRAALVTRVIDGSTLDAQVEGARTPVGYLGVDTPGLNEPCGMQALQRNLELTANGVLLEADPLYRLDDRRRQLFYAYTADGISIDETLIHDGLGRAARTDAAHGVDLAAAEADAAASTAGCLWAAGS